MKWRGICVQAAAALLVALPCLAAVVTTATVPATRSTNDVITATIWNNDVVGIYSYINNNIVPALNVLTTKGDLYVYTGSALTRLGVGADTTCLTSDSAQATGLKWAAVVSSAVLTTKGDLLTRNATVPIRLPVGSNGKVLTCNSAVAAGLEWDTPTTTIPHGTIVAWSPAVAGTNTIPTGWKLCNGNNGTPNLIGRFVIGTKPNSSGATAAADGFGAYTADAVADGATTHSHSVTVTGTTGLGNASQAVQSGATANIASILHTHTYTSSGTCSDASLEPADYALVYIMFPVLNLWY